MSSRKEYMAQYRSTHRVERKAYERATYEKRRVKDRRRQLWVKYRITPERYDQLLKEQGGGCKICGSTTPGGPGKRGSFMVDHDHETGEVRGLLCHACNTAIGLLGDSPQRCRAAAEYLDTRPRANQPKDGLQQPAPGS